MRTLPALVCGLMAAGLTTVVPIGAAAGPATAPEFPARTTSRAVAHVAWDTSKQLGNGVAKGVEVVDGELRLGEPTGSRTHGGREYATGRWTSPWRTPPFDYTELVASWQARTPGDSWIEVAVRGRTAAGRRSSWDVLGRWAATDRHLERTSVPGQGDDLADVNVDTWQAGSALDSWRLRVTLLRGEGSRGPRVDALGAMVSRLPDVDDVRTSRPGPGSGITLSVPRYSQMVHRGHYPRWGDGGQAWCSPTSTSMVLGYYDALPRPRKYAWVPDDHVDPWVDHAARSTYDDDYEGTGNWPFNTAYAATLTDRAFVTRLRSLREAGLFIEAGIPVIASIAFGQGEIDGLPPETRNGSNGHLLVIVGFTDDGDVVVNDPAAEKRSRVRRTYDRGQFEDAWLPTSGGLVYVIADDEHPLPEGDHRNW